MENSSVEQFEMKNGTVDLTLNFYRLNQLRARHNEEYKRYQKINENGIKTDLDAVDVIYVAYLCANLEKMPDVMSYEEFLMNVKESRARIWQAYGALNTDPKN